MHVCKFKSLQIYKIKKSRNYKFKTLQIANVHLQVHKFASMQVCKFTKPKKSKKIQISNYNFTTLPNCKCAFASSQVCKFIKIQNLEITN